MTWRRYEADDLGFDVPASWRTREVPAYAGPRVDGFAPNVALTRDEMPPGATLAQYVDDLMRALSRRLRRFSLDERGVIDLGDREGIVVRVTWLDDPHLLHQRMLFTEAIDHLAQQLTVTCLASQRVTVDPLVDACFGAVRLAPLARHLRLLPRPPRAHAPHAAPRPDGAPVPPSPRPAPSRRG